MSLQIDWPLSWQSAKRQRRERVAFYIICSIESVRRESQPRKGIEFHPPADRRIWTDGWTDGRLLDREKWWTPGNCVYVCAPHLRTTLYMSLVYLIVFQVRRWIHVRGKANGRVEPSAARDKRNMSIYKKADTETQTADGKTNKSQIK
jgi:hypothetical protein